MARVLVTRPEPHAGGTAARLAALGHAAVVAPMLQVAPRRDVAIDLAGVAALAMTSRTAVEVVAGLLAVRPELAGLTALPLFTVGDATAAAARAAGFSTTESADGDVEDLRALILRRVPAGAGTVLHLAGEHRFGELAESLRAAGQPAQSLVVYTAGMAAGLPDAAAAALANGGLDAVLVYSARTAQSLVSAAEAAGVLPALAALPCLGLSAAALAPLAAAGVPDLRVAAAPNENALFALLGELAPGKR